MRPVNLLPADQRPTKASGKLGGSAYVVVGVLGVLLVMTLLYVTSANSITGKKDEIAKVEREATRAQAQADALKPYATLGDIRDTRVKSVSDLATTRFDWERFMRELALVLPQHAWVNKVDASTAGDAASGATPGASPPAAGLPAAGPSAHITGCAKGHDGVAEVLVRMGKLYRAEDVKLATSKKAGGAESAGASPATAGGSGDGTCGKLNTFDLTVSFSASGPSGPTGGVPVALGGGE